MKTFSIRQALRYGFVTTWQHIVFSLVATSIMTLIGIAGFCVFIGINWPTVSSLINNLPTECNTMLLDEPSQTSVQICIKYLVDFFSVNWLTSTMLFMVSVLFVIALGFYIILGWLNAMLYVYDHDRGSVRELFASLRLLPSFIVASFFYTLIICGGFILLIIPGIIWGLAFGMFGYVIVDKKIGAMQALRSAYAITYGAKMKLFQLAIVVGLINLASTLIVFLLGKLIGNFLIMRFVDSIFNLFFYIVTSLVGVYTYRILDAQTFPPAPIEPSVPLYPTE